MFLIQADNITVIPPCEPSCDCHKEDNQITLHHLESFVMKKYGGMEETSLLYSIVRNAKTLWQGVYFILYGCQSTLNILVHPLQTSSIRYQY
jgi:hypothetical protein